MMAIQVKALRATVVTLALLVVSLSLVTFIPLDSSALTPHAPILIQGNADFTAANGVTGGSGTPSDPYIIEGWDVNHSGYRGCGIQITNTDAHFIIQNLLVHDGVWGPFGGEYDAICIGPIVANGHVESVETRLNWNAVVVISSRDINISVNYANGDWGSAVSIYFSDNIRVTRNLAATIQHSNESAGVYVVASSNVTIIDNQLLDAYNGVSLTDSTNITVIGNRLEGNIGWGAFVRNSTGIRVHHNIFIDNSVLYGGIQAHDDRGSENSWDDGCSGGGNYWSDYNGSDGIDCSTGGAGIDGFGDSPRVIDADSQDRYPLVFSSMADPVRPYWHNSSAMEVTASAIQNYPGFRNIVLWHRYSADNGTWGDWTYYYSISTPPWSWSFSFPDGEGHYEFYTIATGVTGKAEPPPAIRDAFAGYDVTPPSSTALPIAPYFHAAPPVVVDATASDNLSGVDNVTMFYSFSSDNNATWSGWTSFGTDETPPWSWSFPFPDGQGHYRFNTLARDVAGNAEAPKTTTEAMAAFLVPTNPPITTLSVGQPNFTSTAIYVKSSTPLALTVVDWSGTGINHTWFRIDNVTWIDYSSSFSISGDGNHFVEYYSEDKAGNSEPINSKVIRVDDTPPATAIVMGEPKYLTGGPFIKSTTPISFSATDVGVGSNSTFYRLWDTFAAFWSSWGEISPTDLLFIHGDGTWFVEFLSYDYLGNMETIQNETLVLDNSPPVTTISIAAPFTLTATDAGCGVNVTMYKLDGGSWTVYAGGFTLAEGERTIYYYSIDNLGNVEQERSLIVTQPVEVEVNYKPIVALIFALILLVAGIWSSKRRPWKGGKDRMAVAKAFSITSLPFVLAEIATGVMSSRAGLLQIPPLMGLAMGVDMAILLIGLIISLTRGIQRRHPELEVVDAPREYSR